MLLLPTTGMTLPTSIDRIREGIGQYALGQYILSYLQPPQPGISTNRKKRVPTKHRSTAACDSCQWGLTWNPWHGQPFDFARGRRGRVFMGGTGPQPRCVAFGNPDAHAITVFWIEPVVMEVVANQSQAPNPSLRGRTYSFLNATTSASGINKAFNLFIVTLILLNIVAMILESVQKIHDLMRGCFLLFECFSVAVFSVEYVLRMWSCVEEPQYRRPILGRLRFALTPLALVDLSAVLPFYLRFIRADLRVMRMFRMVRIMRIMRIAKLGRYSESLQMLMRVLRSRGEQLASAVFILLILLVVAATLMYSAEKQAQPKMFSSIPAAMWWAAVTLTTVGYGDMYPITAIGKIMGAITAMLGIGMFALPCAILGAGFIEEIEQNKKPRKCPHCGKEL
jgi:voltage-gated potassium channel